jgi:hypothetical protein
VSEKEKIVQSVKIKFFYTENFSLGNMEQTCCDVFMLNETRNPGHGMCSER